MEHPLIGATFAPGSTQLLAAVWRAPEVPWLGEDIAYYLYEGAAHPTQSDYRYFASQGLAGMVMRPHVRRRLHVSATDATLLNELMKEQSSPCPT